MSIMIPVVAVFRAIPGSTRLPAKKRRRIGLTVIATARTIVGHGRRVRLAVNEFAVDFRADSHFYQIVIDVADHLGGRTEFDPAGRCHVPFDCSFQQYTRDLNISLYRSALADTEH